MFASTFVAFALAGSPGAEANIREAIRRLAPDSKIDAIASAIVPGFHEVVIGNQVVYVSDDGRHVFSGTLIDAKTGRDVTEIRRASIRKSALDAFGAESRISFAAPGEKYRVTVFTDVDCGYCRRMHQEIAAYNAEGISVDYLFFPRSGPDTPSFDAAVAVSCAADCNEAFGRALGGEKLPAATCLADGVVGRSFRAALAVGATGTPMAYLADGCFIGGYLTPQQMSQRLAEMAAKP